MCRACLFCICCRPHHAPYLFAHPSQYAISGRKCWAEMAPSPALRPIAASVKASTASRRECPSRRYAASSGSLRTTPRGRYQRVSVARTHSAQGVHVPIRRNGLAVDDGKRLLRRVRQPRLRRSERVQARVRPAAAVRRWHQERACRVVRLAGRGVGGDHDALDARQVARIHDCAEGIDDAAPVRRRTGARVDKDQCGVGDHCCGMVRPAVV